MPVIVEHLENLAFFLGDLVELVFGNWVVAVWTFPAREVLVKSLFAKPIDLTAGKKVQVHGILLFDNGSHFTG